MCGNAIVRASAYMRGFYPGQEGNSEIKEVLKDKTKDNRSSKEILFLPSLMSSKMGLTFTVFSHRNLVSINEVILRCILA